jgi:hypothetical protein
MLVYVATAINTACANELDRGGLWTLPCLLYRSRIAVAMQFL